MVEAFSQGREVKTIQVETSTLNSILAEHEIEEIDLLKIDIEGAEMAALRGFDLDRYAPALLVIETPRDGPVVPYLESRGYEVIEKYLAADKINVYLQKSQQTKDVSSKTDA